MNKILLRRTNENDELRPYNFSTDSGLEGLARELGDVVVIPCFVDGGFIVGLSNEGDYAVRTPFGAIKDHEDLTKRVYGFCTEYGKKLAESLPEKYEFVDETGGLREIKLLHL
jgi:hypothetical protein